jgi:OmpA-OmpF porin, OOP family
MTRTARRRCVHIAVGLLLTANSVEAQIGGRIRQQVKQRVDRQVDQTVSRTLDEVECVITDRTCIEQAERDGKALRVTDGDGNEVVGGAAVSLQPGQGAWANYEFVPGERVLFTDDFTRDRVGNFPQRLEHIQGNMEMRLFSV